MPPSNLPLRWESTGDQWWYASPVDWAAANGHYDLVRELLRLDSNHLIKLTSLRRIRRLETVWDDEAQFDHVAKCRSQVAQKLFVECENRQGKNSLIKAGYGGWLLYTAASAGDLGFVQLLLEREPLLVFGEGEFGVTDILYAAARSKKCDVFRLVFDFAASPRFSSGKGRELEEHIEDVPPVFKQEMVNRAVHAAARGGNMVILKELLSGCPDVLLYRDVHGSTILHTAAGRGQAEVVRDLIASYDIIDSVDSRGNTALHVAAFRGQLDVVEVLIRASPSSMFMTNSAGETFLHMAVSGFQTPGFRRLDRQIEFMKQLVCGNVSSVEDIINAKNNEGRTVLHMAIIGNIHSDLVELLMTVRSINVNIRDCDYMTPLDILRQRPRSASSEILVRQLISAGGIFGGRYNARQAVVSQLKMQGIGSSPGTSFRVPDTEMFLCTGLENGSDESVAQDATGKSSHFTEPHQPHPVHDQQKPLPTRKSGSMNNAARRLKILLHWPRMRDKKPEKKIKNLGDDGTAESLKTRRSSSDEIPAPLRQRFSKTSALSSNKRTLSVRSNQPSPVAKKKFASGIVHGVMQAIPHLVIPGRSRSSSFSISTLSSPTSLDKQKGIHIAVDEAGPSCSSQVFCEVTPRSAQKGVSANKNNSRNHFFCFGDPALPVKEPAIRQTRNSTYRPAAIPVA